MGGSASRGAAAAPSRRFRCIGEAVRLDGNLFDKAWGNAARPAVPTGIDRGNWRLRQADTGPSDHRLARRIGFAGRIFPVNANYPSVLNRPCYASPAELPEAPDIKVFCLGHERVFSAFEAAAKRGMKAAVIYDGGFAEQGAEGRALQARIAAICNEAGIALCGPNCMGILNPHHKSTTYLQELREPGLAGNVAILSHRQLVWEIERQLAADGARPVIFYPRGATCRYPRVKGMTVMINSIYNGYGYEDLWLDN